MPLFADNNIPSAYLKGINRCRIFLKVLTIADMASADGKKYATIYGKEKRTQINISDAIH